MSADADQGPQSDLFGHSASGGPSTPPGFSYLPDLLTETEEADLLSFIGTLNLTSFNYMGVPSKRQVRNFGVDFDYERKVAVEAPPIPPVFDRVLEAVAQATGAPRAELVELLVTYYPAGAEITWHKDSRAFESVYGVSLLADTRLQLRPASGKKRERSDIITLNVARRSLYVLDGEARAKWLHHVPPVKQPRYSLTIRTLRPDTQVFPAADLAQYRPE